MHAVSMCSSMIQTSCRLIREHDHWIQQGTTRYYRTAVNYSRIQCCRTDLLTVSKLDLNDSAARSHSSSCRYEVKIMDAHHTNTPAYKTQCDENEQRCSPRTNSHAHYGSLQQHRTSTLLVRGIGDTCLCTLKYSETVQR